MKQLLVIAIALTAINAQASRARVQALGNSAHLVDTNTVYNNPADVFALPSDYVVLESGATTGTAATAANANAEGMIVRTMGDAKLGLSLGHQSPNASSWGLRGAAVNAALEANQQNPVELTYGAKAGDLGWAGTLVYSNYNDKAAAGAVLEKENSLGARLGFRASNWDAAVRLGLSSVTQLADSSKLTGQTSIGANGGYWMDNLYVYGGLSTAGIKENDATGTELQKVTNQAISVGVLSSMKKDGSELFYGAQINSTETKVATAAGDTKVTGLTLPLTIGVEVDAASWLTFRGAVTQTVLINDSKTVTPAATTANTAPGVNNTAVAMGAGLKFNKLTVDGTLQTATTQTINTGALMAQVGATYWF